MIFILLGSLTIVGIAGFGLGVKVTYDIMKPKKNTNIQKQTIRN